MMIDKRISFFTQEHDVLEYILGVYENDVPFSEQIVDFISGFSKELLKSPKARVHPDLVALGYWMRKSNLLRMEEQFSSREIEDVKFVPRGRVIHFAPSNVDTIFIYSLFISLLVGNKNIVRISSKESEQKSIIIDTINALLDKDCFSRVKKSLCIITYPHAKEITDSLCSDIDLRVIWGGDASVSSISSSPIKGTANDIKFSDKYSICLLDAAALTILDQTAFDDLAKNFVNDSFWFNQQGCSSPRSVFWLNKRGHESLIEKFWEHVEKIAESMFGDSLEDADIVNKRVVEALVCVESDVMHVLNSQAMISRIQCNDLSEHYKIKSLHCGGGLFYEYSVGSISELKPIVDRKLQTLSYFVADKRQLKDELMSHAIYPDRVVKVGQALDFSYVWDGYDLFDAMTRKVNFA